MKNARCQCCGIQINPLLGRLPVLVLEQINRIGYIRLYIVAIEGIQSDGGVSLASPYGVGHTGKSAVGQQLDIRVTNGNADIVQQNVVTRSSRHIVGYLYSVICTIGREQEREVRPFFFAFGSITRNDVTRSHTVNQFFILIKHIQTHIHWGTARCNGRIVDIGREQQLGIGT